VCWWWGAIQIHVSVTFTYWNYNINATELPITPEMQQKLICSSSLQWRKHAKWWQLITQHSKCSMFASLLWHTSHHWVTNDAMLYSRPRSNTHTTHPVFSLVSHWFHILSTNHRVDVRITAYSEATGSVWSLGSRVTAAQKTHYCHVLSVLVQLVAWKRSFLKWTTLYQRAMLNPTHSL